MHISAIELKSGRSAGDLGQRFPTEPMTVFVGPNNAGKSVLLRELELACKDGRAATATLLLKAVAFEGFPSGTDLDQEIEKLTVAPAPNDHQPTGFIFYRSRQGRAQLPLDQFKQSLLHPATNPNFFAIWLYNYTLFLNGPNRTNLINEQGVQDLQQPPTSSLNKLFRDNEKRETVRQIIFDAFGRYLVFDPTSMSTIRLRLSDRPPVNEREERGFDDAAIAFHGSADPIALASDGVKAFTGMIVEAIAGEPKVMLIDEPEAFLHPATAFKLGSEISKIATNAGRNVFVSTHSQNFIMGCLHAGVPVNIIRLTYTNKVATSRLLPNDDLVKMMRNPLLRSAGVISALFYEFVIITEGDTDRAFYQEINERLVRFSNGGIQNCLFINAQNKQTIKTILAPLRELGIPAAVMVDLDVIRDGGSDWTRLLSAAGIPSPLHQSLAVMRNDVKGAFEKTGKDMKVDGGIELLQGASRKAAEHLLEMMADYGVFLVPHGELEGWLKPLGVTSIKSGWLIEIFDRMGADPEAPSYVKPDDEDVWDFMRSVRAWLTNSKRKGIPD